MSISISLPISQVRYGPHNAVATYDESRLIGSVQWQQRQMERVRRHNEREFDTKRYDPIAEMTQWYKRLPEMLGRMEEQGTVSHKVEATYGHRNSPLFINCMELVRALYLPKAEGGLSFTQRTLFRWIVLDGQDMDRVATENDLKYRDVRDHLAAAKNTLYRIIYDRLPD